MSKKELLILPTSLGIVLVALFMLQYILSTDVHYSIQWKESDIVLGDDGVLFIKITNGFPTEVNEAYVLYGLDESSNEPPKRWDIGNINSTDTVRKSLIFNPKYDGRYRVFTKLCFLRNDIHRCKTLHLTLEVF